VFLLAAMRVYIPSRRHHSAFQCGNDSCHVARMSNCEQKGVPGLLKCWSDVSNFSLPQCLIDSERWYCFFRRRRFRDSRWEGVDQGR
jgi:hypothetical protein